MYFQGVLTWYTGFFPAGDQVILPRGVGFTTLQGPFSPRKQRVKVLSCPAGPGEGSVNAYPRA